MVHSIITRPRRLLGALHAGIDTIDSAPQSSWLGVELQALRQAVTWEQYNPKAIVARSVNGFIYAHWRMHIHKTKKPLPRIVSREGLVEV